MPQVKMTQVKMAQVKTQEKNGTWDFRQFCGQIKSLAFLPVEDVPTGMQLFKARYLDEAAPLLEYFCQMYVSGTYVQRRRNLQPGIPARFPLELWNVP